MYSASASSSTEPPNSRLASRIAAITFITGRLYALSRAGSSTTWYCLHHAADGRDLGDVGHRLQLVLEEPVLQRAQFGQVVLAAPIDQRVLVDPADARGIGPQRRLRAGRQPALHLVQILEHPRAREVDVGAVLEQDVDERVAEERVAAHDLGPRHRQHRRRQRIGDLVLDDLRRLARIRRADDHLRVRKVGNRVERRRAHRPHAGNGDERPQRAGRGSDWRPTSG